MKLIIAWFVGSETIFEGSTICPMSEIVCFLVLNFTYSHVENSLFFALDLVVSLYLKFTFQTYQLVYYKLFVFVSSIAKISCILFVSCLVKQHPGRNFVLVEIYDCEILSLRCLIGPMFSLAIVYVIFARWPLPNMSTESSRRRHHTYSFDLQVYRAHYILVHSNSYPLLRLRYF